MPVVRNGADKWKARAAAASRDYVAGVQRPRTPWAQATSQAGDAWQAGVTEAAARNSFTKGVARAGDAAWVNGVQNKGAARYAPGVQASGDRYTTGFAPYAQVIQNTNLPPRGRRGDPANLERVRILAEALNTRRAQIQESGS